MSTLPGAGPPPEHHRLELRPDEGLTVSRGLTTRAGPPTISNSKGGTSLAVTNASCASADAIACTTDRRRMAPLSVAIGSNYKDAWPDVGEKFRSKVVLQPVVRYG